MKIRQQAILVLFLAIILIFANGPSSASEKGEYTTKPIRIISTWPGGGGGDQEIRGFSLYLKKYLPTSIMIENIPGAASKIGLTKLYKSEPDGYTLIYVTLPQPMLNELMSKTDYKTKEFTSVYAYFKRSIALTGNIDTYKTVEELVKAAKTKTFSIGLSSFGSAAHLCALGSLKTWGVNANLVAFETGSDAVVQVAGKHLDAAFTMATTALPLIRGGKVRGLLIYSEDRVKGFEDIPTPSERGYQIPLMYGMGGIVAPPKTPAHVIKILQAACDKASRDPEFLTWAERGKYDVFRLSAEAFQKKILEQYKISEDFLPSILASMGSK